MNSLHFLLGAPLLVAPPLLAQATVTVTLYDIAGLPAATREAMKAEAGRILRQAGVRIGWVDCEIAGQPVNLHACAGPLGAGRFLLQLLPGQNRRNPRASGAATIQKGSSVYACLYPERVRDLARDANWDFADLLGHAAAHELGHLLLDSAGHSHAGIMRARWETEDLRRLSHDGLIFLPGQLAAAKSRDHRAEVDVARAAAAGAAGSGKAPNAP
jgi:hypothetical protein